MLLAGLFLVSGLMLQLEGGPQFLGMHVLGLISLIGCTGYQGPPIPLEQQDPALYAGEALP